MHRHTHYHFFLCVFCNPSQPETKFGARYFPRQGQLDLTRKTNIPGKRQNKQKPLKHIWNIAIVLWALLQDGHW